VVVEVVAEGLGKRDGKLAVLLLVVAGVEDCSKKKFFFNSSFSKRIIGVIYQR